MCWRRNGSCRGARKHSSCQHQEEKGQRSEHCQAAGYHHRLRHLLEKASEISGVDLRQPAATFLQRWRYATTTTPTGSEPAVRIDSPAPLILAGESFAGGKIEGAWLSGMCAAELLSKHP